MNNKTSTGGNPPAPSNPLSKDILHLSHREKGEFWKAEVLWEDEFILVIDKPPGLWVRPNPYDQDQICLQDLLQFGIDNQVGWAKSRACTWLAPVHDLDQEASGILVLARDKQTRNRLKDHFHQEQKTLVFQALVQGVVEEDQFSIDLKIAPRKYLPWLSTANPVLGKKSITNVRVLERFNRYTLLECSPLTWQHHQIRVHLAKRGHSLVGDKHYSGLPLWLSKIKKNYRTSKNKEERPLLDRPALHATSIQLPVASVNPQTTAESGSFVVIESQLAKDLKVAMKFLSR